MGRGIAQRWFRWVVLASVVALVACGPARSSPGGIRGDVGQGGGPAAPPDVPKRWSPVNIVVFAPHPDDETLGMGGVIIKACKAGKRVHIVVMTNGEGFPEAAAKLRRKEMASLKPADLLDLATARQQEVAAAVGRLGLTITDVTFLGYPDTSLSLTYSRNGTNPAKSAGFRQTFGPVYPDYHTEAHGAPAPYLRRFVIADIAELLTKLSPQEVYVPHEADGNADHKATYRFVVDALREVSFTGEMLTYLIHGGHYEWPWPAGADPHAPYEAHVVNGKRVPHDGVTWPPPIRIPLAEAEAKQKLEAIRAYATQAGVYAGLESHVKSEEIFWHGTLR